MLRAVISISQRGNIPLTLLSARGIVQNKLGYSHSYCRPLVRFFANDDSKLKERIRIGPSGIIGGNVGQSLNMGKAGGGDTLSQVRTQPATLGSGPIREVGDQSEKRAEVTSQIHATPSITECGPKSTEDPKPSKPEEMCKDVDQIGSTGQSDTTRSGSGSASNSSTGAGSGSNLADDAIKQLQEVANNLPSKEQVEKFVFRVLAFLYDLIYMTATWTIRFVDEKILQNNTVRHYWKRFHEKMEEAKKN